MKHKIKEIHDEKIPMHKLDSYVRAAELVTGKNPIKKILPVAEKAYELAKKEDKTSAFLCVLVNAIPREKQNSFLNLLLKDIKNLKGAQLDVVSTANLVKQMNTLDDLDKIGIGKESAVIYTKKLLNNEISTAAVIARIAMIEDDPNRIDPQKILYFYSPIAEIINEPIGKKLRNESVNRIWSPAATALSKKLNYLRSVIEKTKDDIKRLLGQNFETRIKEVASAVLKSKEKGYINDLVGCRAILEDAKSAVETAHKIIYTLKKNGINAEVDDYYSKPKKSGYKGVNINFKFSTYKLPIEIQLVDISAAMQNNRIAPHGLHKSYGAIDNSDKLKEKLNNYL